MKNIEVKVLNPDAISDAEKMMVAMARMTQRGATIHNMDDFMELYNRPYKQSTAETMTRLPHPTIQKFGAVNIVIVGASRRFLAQITRHQNEVKFMSGSLQYSDYTEEAKFVVPYAITAMDKEHPALGPYEEPYKDYWTRQYINSCEQAEAEYEVAIKVGIDHDAAGYMMPQGMRNVLVMSALPYEWKHIISQRTCRRNTAETRYVMLKCWEALYNTSTLFEDCGMPCISKQLGMRCPEGSFSCGQPLSTENLVHPTDILKHDFKYLYEEG